METTFEDSGNHVDGRFHEWEVEVTLTSRMAETAAEMAESVAKTGETTKERTSALG